MNLSFAFIRETLKQELAISPSEQSLTFTRVETDSRKVKPGDLFVALKGDAFDGHDFITTALEKGASGILFEKRDGQNFQPNSDAVFFCVKDSLRAFRALAHAYRLQFKSCRFFGVVGAVGKTTTKEFLAASLKGKYQSVLKTTGSQNGFIGIPMTLFELNETHQAAVVEIGIDDIGAMVTHCDLVLPDVVILTATGAEHLENLKDVETAAREECIAITHALARKKPAFVNGEDALAVKTLAPHKINPLLTFYQLTQDVVSPLPGPHNQVNVSGVVSVLKKEGFSLSEIKAGLATFSPVFGRSETKTVKGAHFLCDYYNANPSSVKASLLTLSELSEKNHAPDLVVCLADMLELGTDEERFHRELSFDLIRSQVKTIYLYGKRMKWLEDTLTKDAFRGKLTHFDSKEELAETVLKNISSKQMILIKGSRSMKMEDVFKLISDAD